MSQKVALYRVRKYQVHDRNSCIKIFDSNLPDAFTIEERDKFISCLDTQGLHYFVTTKESEIVACGGFGPKTIRISWLMVHRKLYGHGVKRFLLDRIIREIYKKFGEIDIYLDTSQYYRKFYESNGFTLFDQKMNYYTGGNHRYDMVLRANS